MERGLESKGLLKPLLWLPHSEGREVVAIVGFIRPLRDEASKGIDRFRDRSGIAALLLEHPLHFTTTPLQSILEPGHVVEQTQVVPDLSRLHELACSLRERDVKRSCSTSDRTSDVAREAEQLGSCLGPTKCSHRKEVNFC